MIADSGATSDTERLAWEDGILRLEKGGRTLWRAYASQLAAVATCSAGLWRESLSLAFVRSDGIVYDAPLHATGVAEALDGLGAALGAPIQLTLSAGGRSRIVWPPALDGEGAFEDGRTLAGLGERVLRLVRLRGRGEPALSGALLRHLASRPSGQGSAVGAREAGA